VRSWRAPASSSLNAKGAAAVDAGLSVARQYRTALFTGLSNPKLIVFSAAFFPQFIGAGHPWAPQFAILVATFAAIECSCYGLYAAGGRSLARWLSSARRRRWFDRATGSLFFLFGAGLVAYRA